MFNLVVKTGEWRPGLNSVDIRRFLEYTSEAITAEVNDDISILENCPTIFMLETEREGQPNAKIGTVSNIQKNRREIRFVASFRDDMPSLGNDELSRISEQLFIEDFEFSRGHWAVKPVNLFEVLYSNNSGAAPAPTVFNIDHSAGVNRLQVCAMMPFSPEFNAVYDTIQTAAQSCGMACARAEDIWNNDAIMQDVVDLIVTSQVVICDCTGRNANVFYETGIAHALGRNVILIAQNQQDIPFDVQHIRYIRYLNNDEGRSELAENIEDRIRTLRNR